MKSYLMIACTTLALIGCAHNRGGVGDDSNRQTGYDRNYKMPKSEQYRPSSETVTNDINSGSTSDTGSQENQSPTKDSNQGN